MAPLGSSARRKEIFVQWKDSAMAEGSQRSRRHGTSNPNSVTTRQERKESNGCNSQSISPARKERTSESPIGSRASMKLPSHGNPASPSAVVPRRAPSSEKRPARTGSVYGSPQLQKVAAESTVNLNAEESDDAHGATTERNRSGKSRLTIGSPGRSGTSHRTVEAVSTSTGRILRTPLSEDMDVDRSAWRSSLGSGSDVHMHGKTQRRSGEKGKVQRPATEVLEVNPRYSREEGHRVRGQGRRNDVHFMSGSEGDDHGQCSKESEDESMDAAGDALEEEAGTFTFYNEDDQVHTSAAIGEDVEGESSGEDRGYEYLCNNTDGEDDEYPTESQKRKQRRHEMNARIRKGDRRHAEGLPRNFLLVDEYTKEPYGQGVGSWRKELMVLSNSLDPAIGNINRQPDDAVKEVAEWIQHTWEYERPVKWEIIKDVIARGVSLRRSKLWKDMRQKKGRPDGVSDRSWRSLSNQMKSPAMIKKSENCSKANASRMNFGRTGPSGQVGVRERLRKKLKRSPSPNEIRMEMARPKGYSGLSKREGKVLYIMHGSGDEAVNVERRRGGISGIEGNEDLLAIETREREGVTEDGVNKKVERADDEVISTRVLSLSEEQVAQHPSFIRILNRLEALEKRGTTAVMQCDVVESLHIPVQMTPETSENLQMENEAVRQSGESDSATGHVKRRSSRLKNKVNEEEEEVAI